MDFRLFLFSLLALTQYAHAAADANWPVEYTLPKNHGINATAGSGVPNNLLVASTGEIICVFSEAPPTSSSKGLYLTRSTDDGATWSTPWSLAPLSTMPLGLGQPSATLDTDDNLHLVWSGVDPSTGTPVHTLYYAQLDLATSTWTHQTVIGDHPRGDEYGYYHVTVDRQDRVHIIWHEDSEHGPSSMAANDQAEVFYCVRPASSMVFRPATTLSAVDGFTSAFPVGDFGGTSGNTLAICWRNQMSVSDWDVQMVVSTDGGLTWGAPFIAAGTTSREWDPYLLIDKNGVFHLAFHTQDVSSTADFRLYVGHSSDQGATWQNQGGASGFLQLTPTGYLSQFAKLAYDYSRNVIWLAWKHLYTPTTNECFITHIRSGGEDIETAYEQASDINGVHAYAFHDVAVGRDGRPCITFQHKGDSDPLTGPVSLYFRKRNVAVVASSFTGAFVYAGNAGWFNFDWGSNDEGAAPQLTTYIASGYVYAGNLGWLHMGDGEPLDGVQYSQSGGDYGVNLDPATGLLRGYAYGANFGWVKFNWASVAAMGAHAPKLDLTTGRFSGYAYGANIGWLKLDAASSASLAVNAIISGEDTDGDGITDAYELAQLSAAGLPRSLSLMGPLSDLDQDGVSDLDEFRSGTSAVAAGDAFRTTHTEMTQDGIVLDWTVAPGRVYDIQRSASLTHGSWETIATGLQPPPGATQDGVVIPLPEDVGRQFYRVVVRQPLAP